MKVPKARKLKSGTWFIQLRLGGESIPVTGKTERECIKQAEYIKSQYLVGKREKPAASGSEPPAPKRLTVGEIVDRYIDCRTNIRSPSTIRGYRTIRKNRFKDVMSRYLDDVSDDEWKMLCNEEAYTCSPKTLRNAWALIGPAIHEIAKRKIEGIVLPQVPETDLPFLEPEQLDAFIAAVCGTDVEIPALLALSSLRRSELLALRWENIDLEKKIIYVRGAAVMNSESRLVQRKENKNDTSNRVVPILMDELYDILRAGKEKHPSGLILSCHPNTIWSRITKICVANSFPLVGVHGLRRSFVSLAYHLKIDEDLTMDIGGWKDPHIMRKHYKRLAQSDIRQQSGRLINFFKKTAPAEITVGEAIDILKQQREAYRLDNGDFADAPRVLSAYDMAISALSQQSEEKQEAS